jgi:hypothetical protein
MNRPPFKLNPINSTLPFDPARGAAELQALSSPESFVQHAIVSTSREDMATILQIVSRYIDLCKQYGLQLVKDTGVIAASSMQLGLDLCLAHCRAPLHLQRLLMASDDDLSHDVAGIARNLDRLTGHLREGFTPRHAKPSTESAPKG